MSRLRAFLAELKRRRVWRVAVVYSATAFVVVEVADLFFPRLALPEWSVTLVVVLSVLGFPIALVLAWAFEMGPEGLRRTEVAPTEVVLESAPGRGALFASSVLVALLAAGGWWFFAGHGGSASSLERLAVLPLANLMDDPDQEYFVQGMHDRLISELQQAGVAVIARTSVMRYPTAGTPIREIARELGVDAVIEGSVLRAGDSVAIEARLVDGATEEYLWRQSFGGDLRNVRTLHRDLTRAIAREIRVALTPQAQDRLASTEPVDPEAYEAYLKGRFHLRMPGRAQLETALQYFELALAKDSNYAPAHAGISNVWSVSRQRGYQPPDEATPNANAAARRALELDSTLAEPYYALAITRTWGEWDWEGAESAFRTAIRLDPDYPQARAFYAHLLGILGRSEEAIEQIERARRSDPLDPLLQALHGNVLEILRRYDDAIAQYRGALERSPGHPHPQWSLWLALDRQGQHAEALAEARKWAETAGDREIAEALARGYRQAGYAGAMRAAAETQVARSRTRYISPWHIALWYAAAGENDRVLEWLERAFEVRDPGMPYLGVHPSWDNVRSDPRFQDLLRRMNLPG